MGKVNYNKGGDKDLLLFSDLIKYRKEKEKYYRCREIVIVTPSDVLVIM